MSKRRMIDPSFWQSETVAGLTIEQRYFFIGLFSNADDQGRLRGHPALIRNLIFPFDAPGLEKLQKDLNEIEAIGSIKVYEIDGKIYIQILNWWEYQHPQWAYPSEFPAMPGWNDRLRYRENNAVNTHNWTGELDNYDDDSTPPDNPPDPPKSGSPDGNGLGKLLGNALGNPLGNAIEIELVLDNIKDDEERTRAKISILQTVYQNNIGIGVAPITAQEMNSPPYFNLPVLWWLEAFKISTDNNVRKWSYIRAILDRSITANQSPGALGASKNSYQQNGGQNGAKNHRPTSEPISGDGKSTSPFAVGVAAAFTKRYRPAGS